MISQDVFVKYIPFNSKEEINAWIQEGTPLVSNHQNFSYQSKELIDWKEKNKRNYKPRDGKKAYENIFAHGLKFLIPYGVPRDKWDDFVRAYVEEINNAYKTTKKKDGLLWMCKYSTVNAANYVELVMFTRRVYKNKKTSYQKYTQDYWYKPNGKRASSNPFKRPEGCVLKAKKGSYKLDKNGKKIRQVQTVGETEEVGKTFKYKDFNKFASKFKKKWLKVAKKFEATNSDEYVISRLTVEDNDSSTMRNLKIKKNREICLINNTLREYQKGINSGYTFTDDIYTAFHHLLKEVDEMIHKSYVEFSKIRKHIQTWWIDNVAGDFIEA